MRHTKCTFLACFSVWTGVGYRLSNKLPIAIKSMKSCFKSNSKCSYVLLFFLFSVLFYTLSYGFHFFFESWIFFLKFLLIFKANSHYLNFSIEDISDTCICVFGFPCIWKWSRFTISDNLNTYLLRHFAYRGSCLTFLAPAHLRLLTLSRLMALS